MLREGVGPEQRARDARLAWWLVGASGLVSFTVIALLATAGVRHAAEGFAAGMRKATADAQRQRLAAENAYRVVDIPPDSALPLGEPATWLTARNAPAAALARGERGVVRVTLAVGPDGVPSGCTVAQTSGFDSLDNGTCLALMGAGRFAPALPDEPGGRPGEVRRWTSPPVSWGPDGGSMAAVASYAQSRKPGAAGGPVGNPGLWFGPEAYPPAAQRRGAGGRTVAMLAIGRDGRVSACRVAATSGDADLDAATCRIALTRGQFRPAVDRRGRAVPSQYRLPVRWVLPQG